MSFGLVPSEEDIARQKERQKKYTQKKKMVVALAILLTVSYGLAMASTGRDMQCWESGP